MLYLPDASFTTKHLTVTILANLSCNEQIREMLRYTGLAANLTELLARSSPASVDLLEPAVIVVTNLAIDEVTIPSLFFITIFFCTIDVIVMYVNLVCSLLDWNCGMQEHHR